MKGCVVVPVTLLWHSFLSIHLLQHIFNEIYKYRLSQYRVQYICPKSVPQSLSIEVAFETETVLGSKCRHTIAERANGVDELDPSNGNRESAKTFGNWNPGGTAHVRCKRVV